MIQSTTSPAVRTRLPIAAWTVVAVLVVLAVLVGQAIGWAANPGPTGVFAHCKTAPMTGPHTFSAPPPMCIDPTRNYSATISTTKGDIGIVFLASSTPVTANNFIVLAVNGYFTGQPFFKIGDWYVQSGDPLGTGRGGPGYLLPDEPSKDAWVPGSIGMARLPEGISGSQFFITKGDFQGGPPTAAFNHFATVTIGFDLLGQLGQDDRILRIDVRRA